MDLAAAFGGDAEEAVFDVGGVAGADGPAGEAAAADGFGGAPAEDAFGLAVPVGEDVVGVEGAERGVHAVEEGGEEVAAVGARVLGAERVGGSAVPVSTHRAPPWADCTRCPACCRACRPARGRACPPAGVAAARDLARAAARTGIQLDCGAAHTGFAEIAGVGRVRISG